MLIYLALGAAVLWLVLWSQKSSKPVLKYPQWRIASATLATAAFAGAFFFAMEKQILLAVVLVVVGLWLAASARYPRAAKAQTAVPATDSISISEAYALLDLQPGCTREDVQAAYTRLMKVVHPDKGGGEGLAAKLNAARDRLLKS